MAEKKSTFPPTAQPTSTAASATPPSVPYDLESLKGRTCQTCGCFFEQANPENPLKPQGFCRRITANMVPVRVMEPRIDRQTGQPVLRDGQPVMQPGQDIAFLFLATKRDLTCFDGWRPLGTLPGERTIDTTIRAAREQLEPLLHKLPEDFRPWIGALFGLVVETKN